MKRNFTSFLIAAIFIVLLSQNAYTQEGCTDITACNYDAAATVNDGSCTYPGCTNPAAVNFNADAGCATNNCQCMVANSLYFDDFESYAAGQGLSAQSDVWNTWTAAPQEDATVSSGNALSGVNSVRIAGQQTDLVLPVTALYYGSYEVNFNMLISNQGGYFNLLHQWSPNNTNYQWALDVFFDVDGTVSWVAGGVTGGGTYVVPIFTWVEVQILVDIDNDLGSLYIDGNLLHTWQWSLNNADGSQGLIDFAAINFYGTNTAGGDGYYFVDNVSVNHISIGECNIAIGCPSGCTDALACNFLPSAQCDDGSCYYTDYNSTITIPNGNFENWNSAQGFPDADSWSSLNSISALTGASFGTTQLSPGVSGDYFCRLSVMPNSQGGSNPAAVIVGDYNFITGTGSSGFPVSEVAPTLFGYYRSNVSSPDFAAVGAYFTKYNSALSQTDTVAFGTFVFNQYVTNWTPFYLDIETLINETPDTCQLFFVIGGGYAPVAGNFLDIDNLTFNLPCTGAGCTDAAACNFDSNAIFNNGSCLYVGAPCNDGITETSNDVIQTDCSCLGEIIIPGCTQPSACNYDMTATTDDGSCLFEGQSCDDGDPLTFLDAITSDCICEGQLESIPGCTVPAGCNYNSSATIDDGTCIFPGDSCDDGDPNTANDVYDVNCNCAGVVSVAEIESSIQVFPNPASTELFVMRNGVAPAEVSVLDAQGRMVFSVKRSSRIDLQSLANGLYTVRISDGGLVWEKQIVKQ